MSARGLGLVPLLACASCAALLPDHDEPGGDAGAEVRDAAADLDAAVESDASDVDATTEVDASEPVTENLDWAGGPVPADLPTGLVRSGDIVTDSVTGLVWHAAVSPNLPYSNLDSYCGDSTAGGYTDWRAPRWIELSGIVDYSRESPPHDPAIFDSPSLGFVWSGSATYAPALRAGFTAGDGRLTFLDPSRPDAVGRCVRGTSATHTAPTVRYELAAEVVTDLRTGLAWQRDPGAARYSYDDAHAACTNLVLPGTGWRLPTIKELHTLLDLSTTLPTRWYAPAFGSVVARETWSSTRRLSDADEYWYVDFGTGTQSSDDGSTHAYAARCVRTP